MGCDIHCYIEHLEKDDKRWKSFGGHINPGRNYWAFGRLAGVRHDGSPHVAPRGLPGDLGFSAAEDNTVYVDDSNRQRAESWVANGISKWTSIHHNFVTHPDWHSHSWLTADEWDTAIQRADKDMESYGGRCDDEYHAILAVLRFFESRGHSARVVFWFDN